MNNNDRFVNEALVKITKNLDLDDSKLNILLNTLYDCVRDYNIYFTNRANGSFEDYLDLYSQSMQFLNLSANTIKNYIYTLKQLDIFTNKSVQDINIFDLRLFISHKKETEKVKINTLNNIINKIKSFFGFLFDEGYIESNPSTKLRKIKEPKRIKKALSTIELEELRNGCKDDLERALVEFLYSTGMRISEVVKLNLSDLNYNNKSIYVVGKGDKERNVLFSDKAKYYLDKYLKFRRDKNIDSEALFCANRKPFSRLGARAIQQRLKKIKDRQLIKAEVTPHTLRRTMATNLLCAGADITTVQALLGHVNLSTTQLYAQTNFANVQNQYRMCIDL